MKKIPLTGGGFTIINNSDYERVNRYTWRLRWDGRADAKVNRKKVLLHRFILMPASFEQIDHKNRNPLDNRRRNLRICNHRQNTFNRIGLPKIRVCKYKGVTRKQGMFVATVLNRGKSKRAYVGSFKTERQAAIAYDIRASELHGEFKRLNIPKASAKEILEVRRIIDSPKANIRSATSRFFGVGFNRRNNWWRARIHGVDIGRFDTEMKAVKAYNAEAKKRGLAVNKL